MSQDNPLKVLHSILDPSSEESSDAVLDAWEKIASESDKMQIIEFRELFPDENLRNIEIKRIIREKFVFVGISNTKLDASKLNRMIQVARPIMGVEDYKETSKVLFETICKEMINQIPEDFKKELESSVQDISEMLANCTVKFNYECRKSHKVIERGMHGSRDNISLIKFIFKRLNTEYATAIHQYKLDFSEEQETKGKVKIENLQRKLAEFAREGIEKNYSGTHNSFSKFF